MRILHRYTGAVLYEDEHETMRETVEAAVVAGAYLAGADLARAYLADANLAGANLTGANLAGAKMPDGLRWEQYLSDVVPALLVAGGKPLESFREHFECHDWTNCPIAHAFDAETINDVPALLRPRAEEFIRYFDAQLIPWDTATPREGEAGGSER